jgi:ACS family D-galactonate transporter-like MFS transporter
LTSQPKQIQIQKQHRSASFLWFALILLVISVCINYIDRGNLSVAKTAIQKELSLNPEQMGRLLSAFFWTYSVSLIFAGWLIDRINVNWLYAGGYLLWSAATAFTGFVNGFEMLFVLRLLLGISESVAYPCYSKIIANSFSEGQRGVANSLIDAGSKLGPAFGIFVCAKLMDLHGWRMMFALIGGVSMLWLIPWAWVAWVQRSDHPVATPGVRKAQAVPMREILTNRSFVGTAFGLFGLNYAWYFLLTWLPGYLVDARGYSTAEMAQFGPLPFYSVALSSALWGFVSDKMIRGGASTTKVRKGFFISGLVLTAIFLLPSAMVDSPNHSLWLQVIAAFCFGMATSNLWAMTQTMAGSHAAASWTGIQNAFGNLAGVVAPWLTGWFVQITGSFFTAFALAAGMAVGGALCYLLIVRDVKEVRWKSQA